MTQPGPGVDGHREVDGPAAGLPADGKGGASTAGHGGATGRGNGGAAERGEGGDGGASAAGDGGTTARGDGGATAPGGGSGTARGDGSGSGADRGGARRHPAPGGDPRRRPRVGVPGGAGSTPYGRAPDRAGRHILSYLAGPARPGSKVYIAAGDQQLAAAGGRWIGPTRVLVRLAPWALLAGGLFVDAVLPVRFSAVPIFVAAPLIAAPFYQMRYVLIVNALALLGVLVRNIERSTIGAANGVTQLSTCVVVVLLAVLINRVVRRGETLLVSAREIASAAQRAVLPEPAERIAGLEVAARYESAQAGASIGGDFYAVQDTRRGVRVLVGDVRGKGMGAVAAVSVLIGAFREAAEQEASLEAVAQRLDRALAREAAMRRGDEAFEEFATAVFAEIPHGDGSVRIVNRGHPWPIIVYADGALLEAATEEGSLPLGMSELGAWPPQPQNLTFPHGATLLMFTDGVTEARDEQGYFFDPMASLSGQVVGTPGRLLNVVVEEVRRHTGGAGADDLALLAVRRP